MVSPQHQADPADDPTAPLLELILHTLDEGKAEQLVSIDLRGRSSLADYMVIASGRSSRQVTALADQVASRLKDEGFGGTSTEGKEHGDWVLLDAGDVIVHIFRPEVRAYYNLEKMWGAVPPPPPVSAFDPDDDEDDEELIFDEEELIDGDAADEEEDGEE